MVKPQDKEMKIQWITVDGRRTPVILPQIWDHEKEDWVVTSTENPLPTQVTGSNVEDAESIPVRSTRRLVAYKQVVSERVPALSYFYLTPNVEKAVDNFNEFILLLRWEDDPTDFDFVVTYYHAPNQSRVVAEDTYKIDDLGKSISLKSPYFRVYVRNKDDVERMIKFAIITGR